MYIPWSLIQIANFREIVHRFNNGNHWWKSKQLTPNPKILLGRIAIRLEYHSEWSPIKLARYECTDLYNNSIAVFNQQETLLVESHHKKSPEFNDPPLGRLSLATYFLYGLFTYVNTYTKCNQSSSWTKKKKEVRLGINLDFDVLHGCKLFWIGFQELGGLLLKLFLTAFSGATIIDSFTLLGLTASDVKEPINLLESLGSCVSILGGNDLPKTINIWDKNKNNRRKMVL